MSFLDRLASDLNMLIGLGAMLGLAFSLGWLARNWIRELHRQTSVRRPSGRPNREPGN